MSMGNINQMISDNMKYIQQLQANPPASTTAASTTAATNTNAQMQQMMPMIMRMMFQMMSRMMPGQAQSPPLDPFAGLPNTLPPNANMNPNGLLDQQRIQQNPAYQFLTAQLNGSNTATGTIAIPPDFSNTNSLINQVNALTGGLADPNLQNLGSQLSGLSADSPQWATLKTQTETALKNQGSSDTAIAQFDLLFQGIQANNSTGQIVSQLQAVGANLDPASTESQQLQSQLSQVSQLLTQSQSEMAQQWQALEPNASTASVTTPSLVTQVQTALANHQFTPQDLGQSLKYLLNNAPAGSLNQLSGLMASLIKSGTLNSDPFLQSGYLDMLSPDRQAALMSAVQTSGLTLDNGQPNSRFAGFILDSLAKPGLSSTKDFLNQFLQWDAANYQNSNTPEGQALANLLPLAGQNYTTPPIGL